jgi:hypothetical protein
VNAAYPRASPGPSCHQRRPWPHRGGCQCWPRSSWRSPAGRGVSDGSSTTTGTDLVGLLGSLGALALDGLDDGVDWRIKFSDTSLPPSAKLTGVSDCGGARTSVSTSGRGREAADRILNKGNQPRQRFRQLCARVDSRMVDRAGFEKGWGSVRAWGEEELVGAETRGKSPFYSGQP